MREIISESKNAVLDLGIFFLKWNICYHLMLSDSSTGQVCQVIRYKLQSDVNTKPMLLTNLTCLTVSIRS